MQCLFSAKDMKNIISLSTVEFAMRVVKVNEIAREKIVSYLSLYFYGQSSFMSDLSLFPNSISVDLTDPQLARKTQ